MSFFKELKRRSVYRVAALYVLISWLVLQVADVFMSFLPLPEWTPNLVFVLLVLGFPVALVLAWAFELTPDGVRLDAAGDTARSAGGFRKLDILIAAGFVAIAVYVINSQYGSEPVAVTPQHAVAPAQINSIVVLPLEDLTNDPGQAYFVAGMHDALITELSKVEALRVISRTSAMAYQGTDKSLPQIARELNVDAVVEGSVLRAGDTVRVTAQLIEAGSDRHLWAENYDRQLTDILALYGEVATQIVEQVRVKITPEESRRLVVHREVDPAVYERYLQARYLCDNWSPEEMQQGIVLMREVVKLDPDYAPAHAELALCLQYAAFFNYVRSLDIYEESLAEAKLALELDPGLAEAHVAMAGIKYYIEYDRAEAEVQLERALDLNPGSVKALIHSSWLHGESGQFEKAMPVTLKAIETDPLNTVAAHALGQIYWLARDHERAVDAYTHALSLDPRDPFLRSSLAMALLKVGQHEAAVEQAIASLELSGRVPLYVGIMVYVQAKRGKDQEARKLFSELKADARVGPFETAIAHLGFGEWDQAIGALEQAYEERNSQIVYLALAEEFDPLRESPRFKKLMEKLGW